MSPSKHLAGQGCRQCSNERLSQKRRLSVWKIIERIGFRHGFDRFDYDLRAYVNLHSRIRIYCRRHGWFEQEANAHLRIGCGCPKCRSSRGESRIRRQLKLLCVNFKEQACFSDCRDLRLLRFDFFLPQHRTLIEYDGKQHFKKSKLWGGQESFDRTKRHDELKNRFAIQEGFRLIRIPYWDFDRIEEIMELALVPSPQTKSYA